MNYIKAVIRKISNNNFILHSSNYLIAELFNKAIAFLTIPVFTRLLLPEEYGVLSIFTSIVSIFTVIMGLNMNGSITRKFHEGDKEFYAFLGTNLTFLIVLNLLLLTLGYVFRVFFASFFSIDDKLFYLAILVSSFSFFILFELSYLQASMQSKKYAKLSIIRNLITVIIAIIIVYSLKEDRYMGKVYAQLFTSLLIGVLAIIKLFKLSEIKFNRKHLQYSLAFGIPLIPHALSGFILAQFDRVIINQIVGSYETGIYSFAYNIGMIMNVFVISMNKSWIPILYKNLKSEAYQKINELGNKYSKLTFIIAFLLILFSREIVMIMADEKYYNALEVVPIIILGYVAVFLYTLFSGYTFYRKKTGLISLFTFIAGGTNILLNYIYIPQYGYVAAAWTTLISYLLLFVLHYINARFILKEKVLNLFKITGQLIILIIFISIYMKLNISNIFMLIIIKIILLMIMCIIFSHKEIRSYMRK